MPHPLQVFVQKRSAFADPQADQTPPDFDGPVLSSLLASSKRIAGRWLYPIKNTLERPSVERMLQQIGVPRAEVGGPDIICLGQKGFGPDLFYRETARIVGTPNSVLCFGCGLGAELIQIAAILRPKHILGIDYFNYARGWLIVSSNIKQQYGVDAQFSQVDLREAASANALPRFDLIISGAVLEHLEDLEDNLATLAQLLRPGGYFASQWGPMWYSYGGDHIAAELGFDFGFEHIRLSAKDYWDFYRSHPRNREHIARGEPTWLELGLHNFRRYGEYIEAIKRHFADIQWIKWQLSDAAFRWRDKYSAGWQQLLSQNPELTPLDLVLGGVALVARGLPPRGVDVTV